MDDRELIAIIQAHRRDSLGYEDGDLSQQRAKALDRYNGRPDGKEVEGRSQVVSRDVAVTHLVLLYGVRRRDHQSMPMASR